MVDATGGDVSLNAMLVRSADAGVTDTDTFVIKQSGGAMVRLNGCMTTDKRPCH